MTAPSLALNFFKVVVGAIVLFASEWESSRIAEVREKCPVAETATGFE